MSRVGWYRLRSGRPYHGTIPAGVEEIPAPDAEPVEPAQQAARDLQAIADGYPADLPLVAGVRELLDQLVEPVESSAAVGSDVAGVDLAPDAAEVGEGPPVDGGPATEDEVDGVVGGQEAKRKSRGRGAQEGG